ncbi:alpha/beta hydrolase [Gimesia algae]|uniref:Carboxylesterase NlhH n=1 Tax=Gimesia algae TaxID=2527971 RepID=A0A517VLC8_9PLAN|nr:alpha/beta hydrolase [Gimesia algae]QDT93823.1 Carboxylesterase NlhH [Gimesia algae]
MRYFVSRILMGLFLLGLVTCLIPEPQKSSAQNQKGKKEVPILSNIAPLPKDLKIVEDIEYRPGDRRAWKLNLVMPRERGEKPRPAIIFVHGGGWSSGDKGRGIFKSGPVEYASLGYVCISVNYRLSDEDPFPACLQDVKCAVRWLRAHAEKYNVDPDRIGGFGNSAGAHLVSLLGLVNKNQNLEGDGPWQDQSSLLNAVCVSAIPSDFVNWPGGARNKRTLFQLLNSSETSLEELAIQASPITYVNKQAPPFLVFQGAGDRLVDVSQADSFVAALKTAGAVDITYQRYPKANHDVFTSHRRETYPEMEAFFDRVLMNSPAKIKPTGGAYRKTIPAAS